MFLVSSCSCLCPVHWSPVLSRKWRCSWSSAGRQCPNNISMMNTFIAYLGSLILEILRYYFSTRPPQGKSEGFESCDRPIVQKCPIWVKIGDVLYRVTLKFYGWPWKTIGHLSFAVSSFVQHFIAIGEFKLELESGNAQFGSNSTNFIAVWPWNLTFDLEKR